MIPVFLNGMGANTASGLTYLRNVLPQLSRREDTSTTVAIRPPMQAEFLGLPNIRFAEVPEITGAARRFWFEQTHLPGLIRKSGAGVLISAGNFALRRSPVPQILLSGNSLYTSEDFGRDLRGRGEYAMWVDNRVRAMVAKRSILWANCTVAPTRAFAEELERWVGKRVVAIHHGFDREVFVGDRSPLPADILHKLDCGSDCVRLLHVSHYNYFRNFETLFRAIPLLKQKLPEKKVRLFLTCKLREGENPGNYNTRAAATLVKQLGIGEEVVELGAVPYRFLHHVYRACNLYVTASYAETFAHPLVEAMASGLPVVASDLAVHREVGGDAAEYFPLFDFDALAQRVVTVLTSGDLRLTKVERGKIRSLTFRWDKHVESILNLLTSAGDEERSLRCA
jgi:glycosyltransferase involved in cell wall biosynthesis